MTQVKVNLIKICLKPYRDRETLLYDGLPPHSHWDHLTASMGNSLVLNGILILALNKLITVGRTIRLNLSHLCGLTCRLKSLCHQRSQIYLVVSNYQQLSSKVTLNIIVLKPTNSNNLRTGSMWWLVSITMFLKRLRRRRHSNKEVWMPKSKHRLNNFRWSLRFWPTGFNFLMKPKYTSMVVYLRCSPLTTVSCLWDWDNPILRDNSININKSLEEALQLDSCKC